MIVRVRFGKGRPVQRKRGKNRQLALAFGTLLAPAALMAYALGFWRLASDMGLTAEFAITGMFSHWQVWIGLAAVLNLASYSLVRYGRGGELEVPLAVFPGRPPADSSPGPQARARSSAS